MPKTDEKVKVKAPELIEALDALLAMLRDPHPGLMTWHEAVHNRLDAARTLLNDAHNAGITGLVGR